MTPEGKIKSKIDKMLRSKELLWFFKPQAGTFGKSGVPDYIICIAGHFLGVEAKANPARKPTALQMLCMEKICAAEGVCFVVHDNDTLGALEKFIDDVLINRRAQRGLNLC